MVLAELVVGIQTGLDLVLIGSIMVLAGLVGLFFNSAEVALLLASVLGIVYITVGRKKIKPRKRSSRLTTGEFADYVAFIQRRCAEHGIYIPDPV